MGIWTGLGWPRIETSGGFCSLVPTFVCLNTWSIFIDISLCALLICRPSYFLYRKGIKWKD